MTKEFEEVSAMMELNLSDEPELLIGQLEDIEAWNSRMQFLLAVNNSLLDRISFEKMPSKEGKTEFERKIQLDSDTALVREKRDKIEAICEAIKTRITLGQSILRYFSITQNPSMSMNKTSVRQILGENQ